MVYECTSIQEFKELTAEGTVIVVFSVTWSGPCQIISIHFENFSKKYKSIKFVKVDVDEVKEITSQVELGAMPAFIIYKDGQSVDQIVAASPMNLEAFIKKHI